MGQTLQPSAAHFKCRQLSSCVLDYFTQVCCMWLQFFYRGLLPCMPESSSVAPAHMHDPCCKVVVNALA